MCCHLPRCCRKPEEILHRECFQNTCPNSRFFYWLIVLWIFLIILSIGIYGVLLTGVFTLHNDKYSKTVMNFVIQIVNGLFTFAAIQNLPVRCRRLRKLWKEKPESTDGVERKITIELFNSGKREFTTQSTEAWEREKDLIFDRLEWRTKHVILQALLWNSLFQIINQVFRCVYYSYELADTYPGNIFVNVFFPLAIAASLIAALTQALAENRFREKHSLGKKPNNCKKTLIEFWHNLWKDQTEGQKAFAEHTGNTPLEMMGSRLLDLRQRTVDPYNSQGVIPLTSDEGSESEMEACENEVPRIRGNTLEVPVNSQTNRKRGNSLEVPRGKARVKNKDGGQEESIVNEQSNLDEKNNKVAETVSIYVGNLENKDENIKITATAF